MLVHHRLLPSSLSGCFNNFSVPNCTCVCKERHCETEVSCYWKNTTAWPQPALEPKLPDPESSGHPTSRTKKWVCYFVICGVISWSFILSLKNGCYKEILFNCFNNENPTLRICNNIPWVRYGYFLETLYSKL